MVRSWSSRLMVPARSEKEEWIDCYDRSEEEFLQSFRDIRRINRFLGGTAVVRSRLRPLLSPELSILDVGTGLADIPASLQSWGRKMGVNITILGLDANPQILHLARSEVPGLSLITGSAEWLPFQDMSFDVVISSLTFHHFDDRLAVRALQEMHRVAARSVIVNDLRRGYLPAALIWAITRITGMHPLTQHDAPLSVLRSRTLGEYRNLARVAGFCHAQVFAHPFWRAALIVRKEP